MECLQLPIPPLPVMITVGHSIISPGWQHASRSFPVYDMLLVVRGTLYMREDQRSYEIGAGHVLTLEPGLTHLGYRTCEEEAETYWVHFKHAGPSESVDSSQIAWSSMLAAGTDSDPAPLQQTMVLPKWGRLDIKPLIPELDRMVQLHRQLRQRNALQLQTAFMSFMALLQQAVEHAEKPGRSRAVSERIIDYLSKLGAQPYDARQMEQALHFQADYLTRCLRRHIGMTPLQYSLLLRLEEAKRLLARTDMPVTSIAELAGISDYNYFIRLFRKKTGLTPGEYRRLWQVYI